MAKFLLALAIAWLAWRFWYHGPHRRRPRPSAPPPAPPEARELVDARAVLGIDASAGEAEIRAAHRRLIAAVHPDRGGSLELTRRINAARDILLHRTTGA